MEKRKKLLTNIGILLASILFSLVLVELLARFVLWHLMDGDGFNHYASIPQLERRYGENYFLGPDVKYIPHRYIGYIPNPAYHTDTDRHNSRGYRGDEFEVPKPEGTFRIVCLGGSTTYSYGVDDYHVSYPYLLQQALNERGYTNVEVINAGAGSYTSWETLLNLEFRVLDIEPDLLIVYHGLNDVYPRMVWPPEAYVGDNSGSVRPLIEEVRVPPIWQYSTAARMFSVTLGLSEPQSSLDFTRHRRPDTYYELEFRQQVRAGTYPSGIFREVPMTEMLAANPPIYYERNLRDMVSIADSIDIPIVLSTFAYSMEFPEDERSRSEYWDAIDENNVAMREVGESTDAYLFDFATIMPGDAVYFTDGRHYTAEGNAYRVELYADYLIENGLIPEP